MPANRELFQGPSEFNRAPVVVVAGGINRPSQNRKTGPMVQITIMPRDKKADRCRRSVCGNCPIMKECYVVECQAPSSQWRSWRAGGYVADDQTPFPRPSRIGMWGDPGALPFEAVAQIVALSVHGWTGYTEAWRDRPDLRPFLMASVHSDTEAREARAQGWRTFRSTRPGEAPEASEIVCPAMNTDRVPGVTCDRCQLCDGSSGPDDKRKSITVPLHGQRANAGKE